MTASPQVVRRAIVRVGNVLMLEAVGDLPRISCRRWGRERLSRCVRVVTALPLPWPLDLREAIAGLWGAILLADLRRNPPPETSA